VWARTVGVVVAMISAIANFAFIPYQPVWSIIIVTVDVLVIWALTVHGRELASP
jgi:NADH:ubiquinone oxidoreductase subunit H